MILTTDVYFINDFALVGVVIFDAWKETSLHLLYASSQSERKLHPLMALVRLHLVLNSLAGARVVLDDAA